jgi:hypothetical protein
VTRPATIVGALKVTRETDLMRRQLETSRGICAFRLWARWRLGRYFVFTGTALYTVLTVPPGNHVAAPSGTDEV